MNFAALDFETANRYPESPCSLGVVVVREGRVVAERLWGIRPHRAFRTFERGNTWIHGITAAAAREWPEFPPVWEEVRPLLEGLPLAAHNAPFDLEVLRRTLALYGLTPPPARGLCTVRLSRRAWPDLESYKLHRVARALGFSFKHHRALEDARACAFLALRAAQVLGVSCFGDLEELAASGSLEEGYEACLEEVPARMAGGAHIPPFRGPREEGAKARVASTRLLDLDREEACGRFRSSDGSRVYRTTLESCTCPAFRHHRVPCKHMLRLVAELEGRKASGE